MEYKDLALLVPLSPELRRLSGVKETVEKARAQVWKIVTDVLTPHMGAMFQSFMPSACPWKTFPLPRPFGVLLGPQDPSGLMAFYLMAKLAQESERQLHSKKLYESGKTVGELKLDEHITLAVKDYAGCTPETQRELEWLTISESGTLTADCCLYHCGLGSSKITDRQEKAVFAAVADYALCVVALGVEEGQTHEGT